MAVLLIAENSGGQIKKAVLEAAGYAAGLAAQLGGEVHALSIGAVSDGELNKLAKYGVSTVHKLEGSDWESFDDRACAQAAEAAARAVGAKAVVMAQTYNGKALAPRLAVRLDAGMLSGLNTMAEPSGDGLRARRPTNSGKGIETLQSHRPVNVITVKVNSYGLKENPKDMNITSFDFSSTAHGAKSLGQHRATDSISITEAEIVVSGGRGLKGPENWQVLLDLAEALGAGTACSKPVADMDWRPHHEHVGQTGIQIAPNLYIAMGISGAIQHLAGINSSKNIVVINKDPEAPFFKIADYGIVADLFEVVPKITAAVKDLKAHA